MPVTSVGDMTSQFTAMRNGGAIKTELSRLGQQLSTGRVEDVTAHLNGQTTRFSGINHSMTRLDGYLQTSSETSQMLSGMQSVLQRVDLLRSESSQQMLLITPASQPTQVDETARAARGSFDAMISTLNTRLADRALMGGIHVEGPPLASANDMLANLQAFVGGALTPTGIIAAVEFWFDDPAGGFSTMAYLGDTGDPVQKRISENNMMSVNARADDPAIKETLKAAALAALAHELPGITPDVKSDLLQESGLRLYAGGSDLVAIQARIGIIEETVERTSVEMTAQRTALAITKNELISADPFDTASRLQAVQLQLETHYTVTARMSQLSLLRYI